MDNHEIKEIFFTGSKPIASPNIHKKVIQIIEGMCQVEHEHETSIDRATLDKRSPSERSIVGHADRVYNPTLILPL